MSNFSFMDNPKFLGYPDCSSMYKLASLAESAFHINRETCAVYVRQTLEFFCPFVSELKGAVYTEDPKYRTIGAYWYGQNKPIFIQVVGYDNFKRIRKVNRTVNSYIHIQGSTRDDSYTDLLEDLYELLLWLYGELGLWTTWKSGGFSSSKIPVGSMPEAVWNDGYLDCAPERTLREMKRAFPNCNTENLCSVEQNGDRCLIRDLHGNLVGELAAPEALQHSQAEIQRLQSRMDSVKQEFERVQEELSQLMHDKDERIRCLEETVEHAARNSQELTASQSQEIDRLRKEIRCLEKDREDIAETYRKKFRTLETQFGVLDEKYQVLLPVEEQRDALRNQVQELMRKRAAMAGDFAQKQNVLSEEIADVRRQLTQAHGRIQQMNDSAADSQLLISRLQRELDQKTAELQAAQETITGILRQYQDETINIIRQYGDNMGGLRAAEANAIKGNARFQMVLANYDRTGQIGNYLQIVRQGLAEMNRGLRLYGRDAGKLREFLWKVKTHYETQIADLEEQLAQKEQELEDERRRNDAFFNSRADFPSAPDRKQIRESDRPVKKKGGRRRTGRFVAMLFFSLVLLGFLGYAAVERGLSDKRLSEHLQVSALASGEASRETMDTFQTPEAGNAILGITSTGEDSAPKESGPSAESTLPEASGNKAGFPIQTKPEQNEDSVPQKDETTTKPEENGLPVPQIVSITSEKEGWMTVTVSSTMNGKFDVRYKSPKDRDWMAYTTTKEKDDTLFLRSGETYTVQVRLCRYDIRNGYNYGDIYSEWSEPKEITIK